MITTQTFQLKTKGSTDILDITDKVQSILSQSKIKEDQITIFVSSSTSGLTTVEYEPGLIQDLKDFYNKIIPQDKTYQHNERWHDGNGHSHVRASLLKPSLTIPFQNSTLLLGTWQQIILIDFDNRERTREVIVQVNGE
ncbi:MAG: secondary thiamine-phosphate synthase enzyme YjbQ [archaeon]